MEASERAVGISQREHTRKANICALFLYPQQTPKKMTTQLTVFERLTLNAVLPPNVGSLAEMVKIGRLRKRLALSDEEKETCSYIEDPTGAARWVPKTDADEATFNFSDDELELIRSGFLLLETSGKVPTDAPFIALYEKFHDEDAVPV